MPKSTFYKISEDKRKRVLDAAMKEFLSVPYNDVSINRIIKEAGIPRGSFYQYFEDKRDLFLYFVDENKKIVSDQIDIELEKVNGNIFDCIDNLIDAFVSHVYKSDFNFYNLLSTEPAILEIMWTNIHEDKINGCFFLSEKINKDLLYVDSEEEYQTLMRLIVAVLRDNVSKVTMHRDLIDKEKYRNEFHAQIQLLKKKFTKWQQPGRG